MVGANDFARSLRKSGELMRAALGRAMVNAAYEVQNQAKENAPVMFGQLRGSITNKAPIFTDNNVGAIVGTNVKHARWIEYGTGIYSEDPASSKQPIRPKNGKVLAWRTNGGKGAWAFAREVKGIKGRFYLRRAFESKKARVQQIIGDAVDAFLSQVVT